MYPRDPRVKKSPYCKLEPCILYRGLPTVLVTQGTVEGLVKDIVRFSLGTRLVSGFSTCLITHILLYV